MSGERPKPQRMCVACRQMRDKRSLLRVVRSPQGELSIDSSGKAPGRGAYLCATAECMKKAKKSHSLDKALKVKLGDDFWQQLEALAVTDEQHE